MAVLWVKKDSLGNYKITDNVEYLILDKIKLDNLYDNRGAFEAWLSTPENIDNPAGVVLNGNKEFIPISIGGGGYAAPLYFTTIDSDVLGYKKLSYVNESTETELSGSITDGEYLFGSYIYDSGLSITNIDAGLWVSSFRVRVSKATGITRLKFEVFVRHTDTTETTLFSIYSIDINNLIYANLKLDSTQPSYTVLPTDRLGVRIYGATTSASSVTINTIIGGGNASYFTTPIRLRHGQLRDLDWDKSDHIGTENTIAIFDNIGNTSYKNITDITLGINSYIEYTTDINGNITNVDYWDTSAKAIKLFTKIITWTDSNPTTITIKDELQNKTLTIIIAYSGDTIINITKTII